MAPIISLLRPAGQSLDGPAGPHLSSDSDSRLFTFESHSQSLIIISPEILARPWINPFEIKLISMFLWISMDN